MWDLHGICCDMLLQYYVYFLCLLIVCIYVFKGDNTNLHLFVTLTKLAPRYTAIVAEYLVTLLDSKVKVKLGVLHNSVKKYW